MYNGYTLTIMIGIAPLLRKPPYQEDPANPTNPACHNHGTVGEIAPVVPIGTRRFLQSTTVPCYATPYDDTAHRIESREP